jgi:hypothetical protein
MVARFDEEGLSFQYPENWRVEREEGDSGWTVTVYSPDTAFALISVREDMPAPEDVAEQTLEVLRQDYPELEAEDRVGLLAGQPAIGHDIQFFSLDLSNTGWTRSFYSSRGTVLVLCQVNDLELPRNEKVLRAICASLQVED